MRLLLDEMHAPAVAEALVASGHDVVAVAVEPELRGCSDRGLLEYARSASLAAGWASEARDHCGLVFTSPRRFNRALEYACAADQAIVTENIGDFASLAAGWASEARDHCGLVFTSPRRFNRASRAYPGNLIAALGAFLASPPVEGRSWQWWLT